MDRKEFLSAFGLGVVAVTCSYCLTGCTNGDGVVSAPTNVDFTLDLTSPAYAPLKNAGQYIYNGGVIVAHIANGAYVAVSQACTHQGATVVYVLSDNQFYCPSHGSRFSTTGAVVRGPAGSALMAYKTTLNGNSLRVFS